MTKENNLEQESEDQNLEEQEGKVDSTEADERKSDDKSGKEQEGSEEDSKEGFFKSTVKYIREALKSDKDEYESKSDDASLSDTDIPDDFSTAAESLGWTGDDIIEFASKGNSGKAYTNEELKTMVPEMLSKLEESEKEPKEEREDDDKKLEKKVKLEDSDEQKELREQIKKEIMEDLGIDDLKEEIGKVKEDRESQNQSIRIDRANKLFDEASKTFEVFGLTKDLPKYPAGTNKGDFILSSPAFQARAEVFNDAEIFIEHQGLGLDEAMAKALSTYKGKHLESNTKRKLVKDLKKHEKHLSGARTSKDVKKTHGSEREEDIDYIKNLQRASGQDVD